MTFFSLKEKLLAINKTIYFDHNDYLREKTTDPFKLKQVLAEAETYIEQALANLDKDKKYFLYGTIGNLFRICEKPQTAIRYLEQNLHDVQEDHHYTRIIVSLIRLGEAYKYNNDHERALYLFHQAINKCDVHTEGARYLDFALQHKGKCLLELKKGKEAINCFENALRIRREKGEPSLIASTQSALDLARKISGFS